MTDIKLNFINNSNDTNNSSVVIFQKNEATSFDLPLAWLVINNPVKGQHYPFVFPTAITVAASDNYYNFTPQQAASYGQRFEVVSDPSGDILRPGGDAGSPDEFEVFNGKQEGFINAHIFRGGKQLAYKLKIIPASKAVFQFAPTLWIGVMPDIEEGAIINDDSVSNVTELSLLGIASADIVMTGGGSIPYEFTLQHIQPA